MFNEILSSKESSRLLGDDPGAIKLNLGEPLNVVLDEEIVEYSGGVSFEEYVLNLLRFMNSLLAHSGI
jgi:hypothetical protein